MSSSKEQKKYYSQPLVGESSEWYHRFLIFKLLDPTYRSVLAAYKAYCKNQKIATNKNITDAPSAWLQASKKYEWDGRARAYDMDALEAARKEEIATKTERTKLWANRISKKRNNDWEDAQMLRAKAKELLDRPIQWITVKVKDAETGQWAIVKKPFGWTTKDAIMMLKVASELSHYAVGSEVDLINAINVMVENGALPADALLFIEKNMTTFHSTLRNFFYAHYKEDWQKKEMQMMLNAPNN